MNKKVRLALFIFSVALFTELPAQNVYFTGLGRALVQNDGLKDNTDAASKLKASGGYTLFDLGINAKPNEVLRGGVILRLRNEFGGFFGDGALMQFRQLQMEGLIAKKVKYEIGDIYLSHTPYTLWNTKNVFAYNDYEADVFSMRRNIVYYENFFVGNAWRMQGVNAKSKIIFSEKGVDSLGIRVYGGRTMETNFTTLPERYFYGGRLDLVQSKYFRIAGNLAGISDIAGTVLNAEVDYDNLVYTTDFGLTLDNEKLKLALNGEVGASHFQLDRKLDTVHHEFDDYFYDLGVEGTYKPLNLTLGVSYRDVGFNFNSPMAQTRRVAAPSDITLTNFPLLNNGTTSRPITLFDPYVQENLMYNQAISTTLMNYFIQYDMVEPYGRATPNRKGFTFKANIQEAEKLFNAGIEADVLSEVVSEGDILTNEKRKFTKIKGGFVFNLNKLMKYKKAIAINAGIRTESSSRKGTNAIDLSSSLIDLGLDVEVIKDLHLLGGAKLFSVKGTEVQTGRDELNQIIKFSGRTFNQTNNIIALGLKYDYDKVGYFSMQYHMVEFDDKEGSKINFNLNQLFFVFGLKF